MSINACGVNLLALTLHCRPSRRKLGLDHLGKAFVYLPEMADVFLRASRLLKV